MKYINRQLWDSYLLEHLEFARTFIDDIPDNPNKGIQFEVLVECLLKYKYCDDDLSFQKTKLSHDGNKDFWAFDNIDELWWAECKNYSPNIALTQLAPTLVMAEINQVSHLMFFSYTSLNVNLQKRIAQYAYKYQKEIFLFDDEALEQLLFSYDKKKLCERFSLYPNPYEGVLYTYSFNEKNSSMINRHTFNGDYKITELNVGDVYDLNIILINRFDTDVWVASAIEDSETNVYFEFLNNNLSGDEEEYILHPNQLILVKYSVRAKKECSQLQLPQIKISYRIGECAKIITSDQSPKYVCNWNKRVVLIGEYYEQIIRNFADMCQQKICGLLVHGAGGTGKTRVLEECETHLIKNKYNIINFIGFDKKASWRDVILEIAYQIFDIEENLISLITCELEEIVTTSITDPAKRKIVDFLHKLKYEKELVDLEIYYEIIFEEMRKNRYAIIIDNLQSYDSELLTFLTKMIQFIGAHQRGASFALLISLNTSLVYDNECINFAAAFQTLSGTYIGSHFKCEDVQGFTKIEQAITYLKTLLCMNEYPLNYNYLKRILLKSSLKPKYIELVARKLLQEDCINKQNNIGYITDKEKFQKVLEQIPPKYEDAFVSSFNTFKSAYSSLEKEIEDALSCIYFFDILSDEMVDLLKLNRKAIFLLCRHDILAAEKYTSKTTYMFEHDLVEMTISTIIYPEILEHAITLIKTKTELFNSILKNQSQQLVLCKLLLNDVSNEEIISIWEKKDSLQISNKFIYKFYFYFIYNLIRLREMFSDEEFMNLINECCKYVRDHVSEVYAENLFDLAYPHLRNISLITKKLAALYYSFVVNLGENKIRLGKSKECLDVFKNYQAELQQIKAEHPDWSVECLYAEAYINNRIFVCGKLSGIPRQNLPNWACSIKVANKYKFWDILCEDYFDLANIYLNIPFNKTRAIGKLKKGFQYYNMLPENIKKKFSVNYFSKQILYLLLQGKYKSSMDMITKALNELENNPYVNYHIFFREKYIKYKIVNLMLLKDMTTRLDDCMEEYEQLLKLNGHLKDNLEWLFLQAKYAYFLEYHDNFDNLAAACYAMFTQLKNRPLEKEYLMLEEIALKYRKLHETCSFLYDRAFGLSKINQILKMDEDAFQKFDIAYRSTAVCTDEDGKGGYYL